MWPSRMYTVNQYFQGHHSFFLHILYRICVDKNTILLQKIILKTLEIPNLQIDLKKDVTFKYMAGYNVIWTQFNKNI